MNTNLRSSKEQTKMQDYRRGRHDTTIQIRKAKKDGLLKSKRMMNGAAAATNDRSTISPEISQSPLKDSADPQTLQQALQCFTEHMRNPRSVATDVLLDRLRSVRRLLCRAEQPPIQPVIQMGFLPHFTRFLQLSDLPDVVFEAEWALTNITSATDCTAAVMDCGAVPLLAQNLLHLDPSVRLQAAWCIGNVAGEGTLYRDRLLAMPEVMHGLIENLKDPHSPDLLLNVAWAVSGLCRGKPHFSAIQPFALHLVNALVGLENSPMDTDKYRVDIVWALSYIAEDERGIETLINLGAAALFVNIIARAPKKCLLVPTVRAMGNLSVGSDSMTDRMLSAGYLEHVMALLNYPSKNVQKDTCWTLSNIAAGNPQHIQMMISQERYCGLFTKIVKLATNSAHEIRKEAIWVLCNIVEIGTYKQLILLMDIGHAMDAFVEALTLETDLEVLLLVLRSLKKLFVRGKEHKQCYVDNFVERGGLDPLEELQAHPNNEVYRLSVSLLEEYFSMDDEEPDQNLDPEPLDEGFSFGVSKTLFPESPMVFSFGASQIHH